MEILNGNLPVSTIRGIGSAQDGKTILADAKANWDGNSPLFISLGVLAWSMTPTDLYQLTDSLEPEFKAVTVDRYFALIREANGLPAKP